MPFQGNFATASEGEGGGDATTEAIVDEFGALTVDDDAIVTSFATSTSPVVKSGAGLTGIIGAGAIDPPRNITITTGAGMGAYNTTDPITISGTDVNGDPQTAQLLLTQANGGETLSTVKTFASITSESYPEMLTGGGSIKSGVGTVVGLRHPPVETDSGFLYAEARSSGLLDIGGAATTIGAAASPPNGAIDFGALMDGSVIGATYIEDLS